MHMYIVHTYNIICMYMYVRICVKTQQKHRQTDTHTHTHTYTHTHTHTYTHTHTHTHTPPACPGGIIPGCTAVLGAPDRLALVSMPATKKQVKYYLNKVHSKQHMNILYCSKHTHIHMYTCKSTIKHTCTCMYIHMYVTQQYNKSGYFLQGNLWDRCNFHRRVHILSICYVMDVCVRT